MNYEKLDGLLPETTMFIHGNLASNRWWYPSEEILRKESKGKNWQGSMILAEFKGCGKNPAPKSIDEINMHNYAADFISLVEKLNVGPVHLVGHSTGGLIAALMMAKAPHLFKKAVLLDPVGAQGVKLDPAIEGAFEAMKTDKNLLTMVMASTIHDCKQDSDFFRQIVIEDAYHAVQTVGAAVVKSLTNFDARKEISVIKNEVLVLHGEHDLLLPLEDSKALSGLMKNSRFAVLQGQGHCTNAENPARFVSTISAFLFH